MLRVIYSDGVEVFGADLETSESYRATELKTRWNHIVETPGIVAKSYDAPMLMPTTGASSGTVQVSAGGAYFPNGEYVYMTGGSLTGLTDADMFPTGDTYMAVKQVDATGQTRPHVVTFTDDMLPTRGWNENGDDALALVNALTGADHITLAKVENINISGDVTLNTGETFRQVLKIPLVELPSTPVLTDVTIQCETGLTHSGVTRARHVEYTPAYLTLTWNASTHPDGIYGYYAALEYLDNDDNTITGSVQTQFLYVGSGGGPAVTGMSFHDLTPGSKCRAKLYALSNSSIPVLSSGTTGGPYYIGSGSTLTMPAIAIEQTYGGVVVKWDPTGSALATLYEVFSSSGTSITGTTGASVDYSQLAWRGYGGRAFVPGQLDDTIYIMARALDYSGALSSNAQITSTTLQGPPAPPTPVGVRMIGVRNPEISDLECSDDWKGDKYSIALKGGIIGDRATTVWEWNHNDIHGTGSTMGQLAVTNGTGITANELVGLHLYLNSNSTDYLITSNTAANAAGAMIIRVTDLDGTSANIYGEVADSTNPAVVHSDADEYEVEFRAHTDDGFLYEIPSRRVRGTPLAWKEPPVPQLIEAELPIGGLYQCNVKALERGTHRSSNKAASRVERVEYDEIDLWNAQGSITVVGTEYGFEITMAPARVVEQISGWEIAYCLDTEGVVNFGNRAHNPKVIDAVQTFRVAVERAGTYRIAVRPLKGGQVVGDTKRTTVASGGGGYLTNYKVLEVPVNLPVNRQSLEYLASEDRVYITEQQGIAVTSGNPAVSVMGMVGWVLSPYLPGINPVYKCVFEQVCDVGVLGSATGVTYNLNLQELTDYGYTFADLSGTGANPFTIYWAGSSSTGSRVQMVRQIAKVPVPNDVKITKLTFDCEYTSATTGAPVLLRVYQLGLESSGVSLEVSGYKEETVWENSVDLDVLQGQGALLLVIDSYRADNGAHNAALLLGTLRIFYRDLAVQTSYSVAGAGGFID